MAYKLRINGVTHTLIQNGDGTVSYSPPLPESEIRRGRNNIREAMKSKRFPGVKTENTFFSGRGTLADQFKDDPEFLQQIIDGAKAKGYNPSPNDIYLQSVAREDGDPDAFVSQADGLGKIRKVCEQRGLYCEELGAERREVAPPEKIALAEDLVAEKVAEYKSVPEFAGKPDGELRELVIEKHGARS